MKFKALHFVFALALLLPHTALASPLCASKPDRSQSLECMDSELKQLKKDLALAEALALKDAKQTDKIAPLYDNEKALLESNKTFEAYKNAECLRQNALTLSGTLTGGLAQISCEIKFTKLRISALRMDDE